MIFQKSKGGGARYVVSQDQGVKQIWRPFRYRSSLLKVQAPPDFSRRRHSQAA